MASPLTDTKVRNAKPAEKPYKLQDGQGLYLDVRPSGAKFWRYRYWITPEKDGIYTIGEYPVVSLSDARREREWAREQAKQGINPTHAKEAERLRRMGEHANTFEAVAREWIDQNRNHWTEKYLYQVERFLGNDVFPKIGALPIRMVTSAHLLGIIRTVEERGAKSIAVLIRQWSGQIFRYAVATLRADSDPSAPLRGAIKKDPVRHNPPLSKDEIPVMLNKLQKYGGYRGTVLATKLMLYTFVRTVELRKAEWTEFDLEGGEWRVPADRMKMKKQMKVGESHIVPLSRQALEVLKELKTLSGGRKFLFPNLRTPDTCMTATTINKALERMGYAGKFSGHGFRATASTMLHELGWNEKAIERQLAHAERNKVKAAYNHAEYLPERREMMQAWSDWIDELARKAAEKEGEAAAAEATAAPKGKRGARSGSRTSAG
ncbi:Integrase [Azospira oryzae PS]|uniref:Integrase n=1 Tax=Azospira oryzae (strain ATCC BAA-33 / DSM 13638 / PS) TaxID=640081 RepID=G8QMQ8_AZOOP|nr:integrase arm-type DNA-binding domain-containing protein [Azospira oryzae]AEV24638.1 Integrase [Azospira oryzae PS]